MTTLQSLSQARSFTLALIALGLTGCTKGCEKKDDAGSTSGQAQTTAPATGMIEIQMWDNEDPEPAKKLDAWMIQFMANNPDIHVVRTTYQTEDLRQKFITTATAGKAADLVFGPSDMTGPLVTANLLQPIDSFTDAAAYAPAALNAVKVGDKTWGVPVSYGNHLMLMFNKDKVPSAPTTTDELISYAKKATKLESKEYGLVMNINEPFWFAPTMGAFGAWPLSLSPDGKATITLNTEENKKALAFWKSLKFEHKIVPSECDYDCARGLFAEKKAAMIINGDWYVDEAKKALGDKLGITALPIVSSTGKPMTPMVSGRYLFLNKDISGARVEAVKKFIAFLTSKPIQVDLATTLGRVPGLIEAQKDPSVAANPTIKSLIDAAANGRAMPPNIEMRAAWDGMRPVLQKIMNGELSPEQGAGEMQTIANERLKGLNE
jgi:arabinogalactan oligomer/maltooligosaccharide transport system substrate-binding protein